MARWFRAALVANGGPTQYYAGGHNVLVDQCMSVCLALKGTFHFIAQPCVV